MPDDHEHNGKAKDEFAELVRRRIEEECQDRLEDCDPFSKDRREAECEKLTEESLLSDEERELAREHACKPYDPCEKPGARLWEPAKAALEDLKDDDFFNENKETIEKIREDLEEANDCEDKRDEVAKKLFERMANLDRACRDGKHKDKGRLRALFLAFWKIRLSWLPQNTSQRMVEDVGNLLCLAEEKLKEFQTAEADCYPNDFLGFDAVRNAGNVTIGNILSRISMQQKLVYNLLGAFDSCASSEFFNFTRKRVLWLQSRIEEDSCSALCEFGRIQSCYSCECSKELVLLLGTAMHYISQGRALMETLEFDAASPWSQCNDRIAKLPQQILKLRAKVQSLKPPVDPCCLQTVLERISRMEASIKILAGTASGLQSVTTATCGLIVQSRRNIAQIEQELGALLCKTSILRCGIREMLLEFSSVNLQVSCFLGYMQKECDRLARKQRLTPATPPPPSLTIVKTLNGNPGIEFAIPQEVSSRFLPRANPNIRLIDVSSGKLLQIISADQSMSSLTVAATEGTILEFQAYANGELIGSSVATASALDAPAGSSSSAS